MKYTFANAGITEQVEFPDEAINNVFIPLLQKLTDLQHEKGRRILVLLAAAPGSGKSTLIDFLRYLSMNTPGLTEVTAIGMDGFHHYQDYLLSHTTIRDGAEIPMVKVKGSPITFDLPLLTERIRRLLAEKEVGWPRYDRVLHNPVDNDIQVTGDIVMLEGNYLLLDKNGWRDLRNYADFTIKLVADEDLLRERLIKRKITTGFDRAAAEKYVDFSDMVNVKTCLAESAKADFEISVGDGSYKTLA